MLYKQVIDNLNLHFRYKKDLIMYNITDAWVYIDQKYKEDELWYGDCEDYALYLLKYIPGCKLWYCILEGGGHAVVELPDGLFIDNNVRKPVKSFPAKWELKYIFPDEVINAKLEASRDLIPKKRKGYDAFRYLMSTAIFKIKRFIKNLFS
jgi:hypothetical protein